MQGQRRAAAMLLACIGMVWAGLMSSAQAAAAPAAQAKITGDWKGTLNAGGADLHLVLHVKQANDGSLTATLDSVDQNADGIPVSAITLNGDKLHLSVDSVHGTYDGTVNADATEIYGKWSQGTPLALDFRRADAAEVGRASPAAGTWLGKLNVGARTLRIVFRITSTPNGLTAEMQSPDQSPMWFPATSAILNGSTVRVTVKKIGGVFTGTLSADGNTLSGTWQQGGGSFSLTLQRVTSEAQLTLPWP